MAKLSNKYPLIVESHPDDYAGYEFITLVRYNDVNYLTVVDNSDVKFIQCYVLDLCKAEDIIESDVVDIAREWYGTSGGEYPVSIEFSKRGLTGTLSKIHRNFSIDFVTRVIGPMPHYSMKGVTKVRKRKRKSIPTGIKLVQRELKKLK